MNTQVQLLVKAENPAGPVERQMYDEEMYLNVRDLTTRAVIRVRAKEISCYLHTLFANGKTYRILNIVKEAALSC